MLVLRLRVRFSKRLPRVLGVGLGRGQRGELLIPSNHLGM
tara:strand:+ start:484 stop:603 length:120 start_codon:yes stop_codon:yes gene_type:complete